MLTLILLGIVFAGGVTAGWLIPQPAWVKPAYDRLVVAIQIIRQS